MVAELAPAVGKEMHLQGHCMYLMSCKFRGTSPGWLKDSARRNRSEN